MQKIRLFVSSPSDVAAERRRVDNVINRIQLDYEGIEFEIIRWEEDFYTAQSTFQNQISSSADADIVLCILWKRLGSPLPEEYKRKDGTSRTGTEYEFETAMEAALSSEMPDILVYRGTREITFTADHVEQEQAELQTLENFWRRWIQNEKGHFTAGFKPFKNTDDFEKLLEKDLRAWLKRRFHDVVWPDTKGSPYRGLNVFEEEHAPIYFGRRRAINEVRARLMANEQRDGIGFLLIIGASGAGKSSLVRAGLIPALKETHQIEGIAGWRTLVIRPTELGSEPITGLCNQLCDVDVLPELLEGDYEQPGELATLLNNNAESAAKPIEAALKRWAKVLTKQEQMSAEADTRLFIAIDQFEELFQFNVEQQVQFLNIIDNLVQSGKVWIVATMRSDFYPQLFSLPELIRLKDASRQYDLNIPRQHELQDIITGPATAAGLNFEKNEHGEGLDQRLLEDAEGNPAALPLLEFTLERLYQEHDRDNKLLTFNAYKKLGGLQGALTQTAEEAFAKVTKQFKDNVDLVFARVMRELIAIDEQGKATRRVAVLKRFKKSDDKLLVNTLLEHRLLTGYTSDINTTDKPEAVVNITHEALIHYWERMQRWLEQDQELLQVRERITQDYQRWLNENKRHDLLATTGKRLEDIRYLKNSGLPLENTTLDYIEASLLRAKQLQKRKRRLQVTFSGISILAGVFGAITLSSLDELQSQKQKIESKEHELISSSIESSGLIAQAEYAKANILKNQNKNMEALNSYYKAIKRARETGRLRLAKKKSLNKSYDTDWLINSSRESTWHINNLIEKNQITKGDSLQPLVSNNEEFILISSESADKEWFASIYNISEKKVIAGPFSIKKHFNFLKVDYASFSPDSKKIAILVREVNKKSQSDSKRRYRQETNTIKVIDTETGKVLTNTLNEVNDFKQLQFIDNDRVAILHNKNISIWDYRKTQNLSSLKTDIPSNGHYNSHFHVVANNTLLLNGQYIWQEDKYGVWSENGYLETAQPVGINFNNNAPVITEDGFITLTSKYESWMPDFLLDIFVGIADSNRLNGMLESFIKIRPVLVKTIIKNDEINTTYTDIPLPDKFKDIDNGYVYNSSLLQKTNDKNNVSFISVFTDFEDRSDYAYRYELSLTDGKPTVPVNLISTSNGRYGKYYSGMSQFNKETILFSTFDGDIIQHDINRKSKNQTNRFSKSIRGLVNLKDNVLISAKSGTYLIPKPITLSDEVAVNISRITTEKNVFLKYAHTYPNGNIWPNTHINKESGDLVISHKSSISKANNAVEINQQESLSKKLNAVGIMFENISHNGDSMKSTILAASQLLPAASPVHKEQMLAHDGKWNKVPINLVNIATNAEHYVILTNDNKLHLMQSHPATYVKDYKHIKSKIRKISVGTEKIAAASEDGNINIINFKNKKRFKFNPNREIKKNQTNTDNQSQYSGSKKNLQGIISSVAWHPTNNDIAVANWNGAINLFSIKNNSVVHNGSTKHANNSPIQKVEWNFSGTQIASADRSGIVNLWDVKNFNNTKQLIHTAKLTHDSGVKSISYSIDNEWIVTATDTDKLYFWDNKGTSIGKPIVLKDTDVREVLINEDNWWVTILAKDGSAYTVEAGGRFIPNKAIEYFDLMTRNELFKHHVVKSKTKDSKNIVEYFRNPPESDKTYWTTLISSLLSCYSSSNCQNNALLTKRLWSTISSNKK